MFDISNIFADVNTVNKDDTDMNNKPSVTVIDTQDKFRKFVDLARYSLTSEELYKIIDKNKDAITRNGGGIRDFEDRIKFDIAIQYCENMKMSYVFINNSCCACSYNPKRALLGLNPYIYEEYVYCDDEWDNCEYLAYLICYIESTNDLLVDTVVINPYWEDYQKELDKNLKIKFDKMVADYLREVA